MITGCHDVGQDNSDLDVGFLHPAESITRTSTLLFDGLAILCVKIQWLSVRVFAVSLRYEMRWSAEIDAPLQLKCDPTPAASLKVSTSDSE